MADVAALTTRAQRDPDRVARSVDGHPTFIPLVEPREHGGVASQIGGTADIVGLPVPIDPDGHDEDELVRDGHVPPWLLHRPRPRNGEHHVRDTVATVLDRVGLAAWVSLAEAAGVEPPRVRVLPTLDATGVPTGVRIEPQAIIPIEIKGAGKHHDRIEGQLARHLRHARRLAGSGMAGPVAVILLTGDRRPPTTLDGLLAAEPQVGVAPANDWYQRLCDQSLLPPDLAGRLELAIDLLGGDPGPGHEDGRLPDGLDPIDRHVPGYLLPEHPGSDRLRPRYLADVDDLVRLIDWPLREPVLDLLRDHDSLTDHALDAAPPHTRLFAVADVLRWTSAAGLGPPRLTRTGDHATLEGVLDTATGRREWLVTLRVGRRRATQAGIPCPSHEPLADQRWRHDGERHAAFVEAGPLWRLVATHGR